MVSPPTRAIRALVTGKVQEVGLRAGTQRRAIELKLLGWVRNEGDGTVVVHAEGSSAAIDALVVFLREGSPAAEPVDVDVDEVPIEGHEQFAVRGVSAGVFVVHEHAARTRHFDLCLEVDGLMRSWALPKGPSLDPSSRRLAVQVEEQAIAKDTFEGATEDGGVMIWDRGHYEQGGRVRWPEALERGHAIFVLHGEKLRGGFALQRTQPRRASDRPRWLLLKRRDEQARPGSDIVAERPASVLSALTLDELLHHSNKD